MLTGTAPVQERVDALSVANGRRGSLRRLANPPERVLRAAEDGFQSEASAAVAAATSPRGDACPKAGASSLRRTQGSAHDHSSRRLRPGANPRDHQPNGQRHQGGIPPAAARRHAVRDGYRRRHPPVAAPFQSIDQTANPMAQHHAGGVVDVHPSSNVTDAGAPTNVPVASRLKRWTHRQSPKPRETDP